MYCITDFDACSSLSYSCTCGQGLPFCEGRRHPLCRLPDLPFPCHITFTFVQAAVSVKLISAFTQRAVLLEVLNSGRGLWTDLNGFGHANSAMYLRMGFDDHHLGSWPSYRCDCRQNPQRNCLPQSVQGFSAVASHNCLMLPCEKVEINVWKTWGEIHPLGV